MKILAYVRLMRFDKPVGIVLLWAPTAWALWLANQGAPSIRLFVCFFAGTVLMRAAGCVINDIADRSIDRHVSRTAERPLTSGMLSLNEAIYLLMTLLLAAFFVVVQLPRACFFYALLALFITVLYPFCKRFFVAPQLVLGLAFSMGIPMVYVASETTFTTAMWLLIWLNIAWIVAYDTMYAMVDKEDDIRIGVQSTAILFGAYDRIIILLLQILLHSLWIVLALRLPHTIWFYGVWFMASFVLVYQQKQMLRKNARAYFHAFSWNMYYGLMMWVALILGYFRA